MTRRRRATERVRRGRLALVAVVLLAAAVVACGEGETPADKAPTARSTGDTLASGGDDEALAGSREVRFAAADGVQLEGRIFGSGEVGVVLSHMGRPGDLQNDWWGVAAALAREGYTALTYNRRGVCGGTEYGCSEGADDLAASWKDVIGAFEYLRAQGASRIVLVGASIGAMSSLYAAASGRIHPAGLMEVGGIDASGYRFRRADIAAIGGTKLFASSEGDVYGGAVAARRWYRWATAPKRLEILPGGLHGTDMLAEGQPTAEPLRALVLEFVAEVARSPH